MVKNMNHEECGCQNEVHSLGLRLSTAEAQAHWGKNYTVEDNRLVKSCEMNMKCIDVLQWILTFPAHDVICRVTHLFGSCHSKMKSGYLNLNNAPTQ